MGVLYNKEETQLIINCDCGCEAGYHFRIEKDNTGENDSYCFCTVLSGNWYSDQDSRILVVWWKKIRKIWAILRNKDFYYADVVMTKKDFMEFKRWIGGID